MAEQDFLAWGTDPGANVESQGNYANPGTNPDLATGYPAGAIPPSARFNKTLRQASFGVAAIAQWMSDKTGADVLDNGVQADFIATFEAAIGEQDQADIQAQAGNYAVAAGAANTYVAVLDPPAVGRITGVPLRIKIPNTNNGASTLDYGAGAFAIRYRGAALSGGELVSGNGNIATFVDDGTFLNLINSGVTKLGTTNITGVTGTGNTAVCSADPTFTGTINGANASLSGSMASASLSTTAAAVVGTTLTVGTGQTVTAGGIDVNNGANLGIRISKTGNNHIVAGGSVISLNLGGAGVASFGIASNEIFPLTDNAQSVGDITHRFTSVFATNGTINTSDRNEKDNIRRIRPELIAVGHRLLARKDAIVEFQWKDAIAKKGQDKARIHVGVIAQDVVDDFAAVFKDKEAAFRFGAVCRDEITIDVKEKQKFPVRKQAMRKVKRDQIVIDGAGDRRVARVQSMEVDELVFDRLPLLGKDGTALATDGLPLLDAQTKKPRKGAEAAVHLEPVMEDTFEEHEVDVRKPTGKFRYSVRPDQIHYLMLAALANPIKE